MAPKTKTPTTKAAVVPSGGGASQDPMLQGTYIHNDTDDFESPSHELDDFDERLVSGQPAHSPQAGGRSAAAAAAGSGARAVAMQKNRKAGGTAAKRPPMRSSFDAVTAPSGESHDGANHRASITEDEVDARDQRQRDIDDVRNLDSRFDDSDNSD